jgi:hypothetical protein
LTYTHSRRRAISLRARRDDRGVLDVLKGGATLP